MSRSGRVAKPQDHVLEVQERAGDPPGVLRDAPVSVRGQPGRGQRPVPGDQVVQDTGVQGRLSRGPGGVAGLDEQATAPLMNQARLTPSARQDTARRT